jgi:hypothetical protein
VLQRVKAGPHAHRSARAALPRLEFDFVPDCQLIRRKPHRFEPQRSSEVSQDPDLELQGHHPE